MNAKIALLNKKMTLFKSQEWPKQINSLWEDIHIDAVSTRLHLSNAAVSRTEKKVGILKIGTEVTPLRTGSATPKPLQIH